MLRDGFIVYYADNQSKIAFHFSLQCQYFDLTLFGARFFDDRFQPLRGLIVDPFFAALHANLRLDVANHHNASSQVHAISGFPRLFTSATDRAKALASVLGRFILLVL